MTKTTEPVLEPQWECFSDPTYYDMWCVRQVGQRTFGEGFHLMHGVEAQALCDMLNTRPAPSPDAATLSAENERLRERVERMGRDKETLLTFARAIQTWRSDADSYDEECDHPQRDYCEDVELMEKAAGYALRRIAERAALAGDSYDQ